MGQPRCAKPRLLLRDGVTMNERCPILGYCGTCLFSLPGAGCAALHSPEIQDRVKANLYLSEMLLFGAEATERCLLYRNRATACTTTRRDGYEDFEEVAFGV